MSNDLREQVALRLGWLWWAFDGCPIRGTSGYPEHCRVRRFFNPRSLANASWKDYLARHNGGPATGQEPLDYSYCSSNGPDILPDYPASFAACEEVLDWLTANGWLWTLARLVNGQIRFTASDFFATAKKELYGMAHTKAEAICLAFVQIPLEDGP